MDDSHNGNVRLQILINLRRLGHQIKPAKSWYSLLERAFDRGFALSRLWPPGSAHPRSWPRRTNRNGSRETSLLLFSLLSLTSRGGRPPPSATVAVFPPVPRWTKLSSQAGRCQSRLLPVQYRPRANPDDLKHACNSRHTDVRLQYLPDAYTLLRPTGRSPVTARQQSTTCARTTAPRLGISCLDACPHTRGKSGCEHANSYCSARLTLTLTPTLTSTLTEPGPLTLPSPSRRLSRAQLSCR